MLKDDGKIDSLVVEKTNKDPQNQFSIGIKINIGDYAAGCGFVDDNSDLDIFSIIPTGKNKLSISREEAFGNWDGTSDFGLVENQITSEKGSYYDNGVLIADFNNDFNQDIIITAHQGSNLFFENKVKKVFTNRTKKSGLFNEDYRNKMAIAGDVDNDGDLDLFITREYTSNVFYLNNGFGKFREATNEANLIHI